MLHLKVTPNRAHGRLHVPVPGGSLHVLGRVGGLKIHQGCTLNPTAQGVVILVPICRQSAADDTA